MSSAAPDSSPPPPASPDRVYSPDARTGTMLMTSRTACDAHALDASCSPNPWSAGALTPVNLYATYDQPARAVNPGRRGYIYRHEGRVVGFVVFDVGLTAIHLQRIVVAPEFRRQGIARQLVDRLLAFTLAMRRASTVADAPAFIAIVPERELTAQLAFRALGFRAVETLHSRVNDGDSEYLFRFDFSGLESDTGRELLG